MTDQRARLSLPFNLLIAILLFPQLRSLSASRKPGMRLPWSSPRSV
jgi:hypothetical protein